MSKISERCGSSRVKIAGGKEFDENESVADSQKGQVTTEGRGSSNQSPGAADR